jgi:hypothetical protein
MLNARKLCTIDGVKMDELRLHAKDISPDIIAVTETWFSETIDTESINITNYTCCRTDRTNRDGGGVCTYFKESIVHGTCLISLSSPTYSINFLLIRIKKRNNIIFSTIYIPPNLKKAEKDTINDLLLNTIAELHKKYKTAKLLLCGDFNDFDTSTLANTCNLMQIVNFSTRNEATLDLILTDIPCYSGKAEKIPPLSTCDHNMVFLNQPTLKPKYVRKIKRIFTKNSKQQIIDSLIYENWDEVYNSHDVETKAEVFENTLKRHLDKFCPKKIYQSEIR